MVIDKPQCSLDTCKYYFDGNCTNEKRYRTCEFAYLKTLEATGRLIELPCKMGDTVWAIAEMDGYVYKQLVISEPQAVFIKDLWNNRYFTTKEEAEVKLKELQGE